MHKSSFVSVMLIFASIAGLCVVGSSLSKALDDTPQWRGQKQDAAAILHGRYIGLQADGWDASSLHQAILSTNETGNWRNETTSAVMWNQSAVNGFDNFGTTTYKDGVLYAPSKGDDMLYAVNASNGAIIWNTTVRQCDGSPCIDGDVVYVGECMGVYQPTPQSKAMALNRTNGQVVWQFVEPNDNGWVGSPVVNGQYVYYTTCNFNESDTSTSPGVYALNKTNGNVLWHQAIGNILGSVAYDNGTVFISVYYPAAQYALNATTGQQIWRQSYGSSWDSSPVIYGGMVVQVTVIGGVWSTSVLNETNGQLIRQFQAIGSTGPLVDNGNVFFPSNDWTMWAFSLTTGTELWRTVPIHDGTLQRYFYSSPASADGAIYCQALNGTFYAINETGGHVLWSYNLGDLGFGSPSIGDGCVFITNDGGLYAFRIGDGIGDWPMFCQNNYHTSSSQHGVEYVRWPLTQPQFLGDVSNTWVTARFVWCNNSIVQATIAWKIYFFDSNGNANATDVQVFYVNAPTHDVAVIDVAPRKTVIGQNLTAQLNVTVANQGDYTETFNVTAYANATAALTDNVTLSSGNFAALSFTWNTTGFSYSNYTITAYAWPVTNETDTANNNFTCSNPVHVGVPGDISSAVPGVYDGVDNMKDVAYLVSLFNTRPTSANWNPNADINNDGVCNMRDIAIAIFYFNQHE